MRSTILWVLSGVMLAVIVLFIAATLPPGEGFVYPLRRLFFQIRPFAYLGTVLVVTLVCIYTIPLLVSRGISPLDPETYRPILPDMRAFATLLAVSVVAYLILSRQNIVPRELNSLRIGDTRYYLILEEGQFFRDRFLLYECDSRGVICRTIFAERGPRYEYDLELRRDGSVVIITDGDDTLFRLDEVP